MAKKKKKKPYPREVTIDGKYKYKLNMVGEVNTEVASLLIIDPCMLFNDEEWKRVFRKRGTYQDKIIKGLGEKLGLSRKIIKFLLESSAVVEVGADGTYIVAQPDGGLPVVIGWPQVGWDE